MKYNLSQENDNKKKEYEDTIAENKKKYLEIKERISKLEANRHKKRNNSEIQYDKLELTIKQKELELEIDQKKQAIEKLYIKEIKEQIVQKVNNKEISREEFANKTKNIREYSLMMDDYDNMADQNSEKIILELKIKLEKLKKSMGKVSKEQSNKNIEEMQEKLKDIEKDQETILEYLPGQTFKLMKTNLYYKKNIGEISKEELRKKLKELEQSRDKYLSKEEVTEFFEKLKEETLELKLTEKPETEEDGSVFHAGKKFSSQELNPEKIIKEAGKRMGNKFREAKKICLTQLKRGGNPRAEEDGSVFHAGKKFSSQELNPEKIIKKAGKRMGDNFQKAKKFCLDQLKRGGNPRAEEDGSGFQPKKRGENPKSEEDGSGFHPKKRGKNPKSENDKTEGDKIAEVMLCRIIKKAEGENVIKEDLLIAAYQNKAIDLKDLLEAYEKMSETEAERKGKNDPEFKGR